MKNMVMTMFAVSQAVMSDVDKVMSIESCMSQDVCVIGFPHTKISLVL